MGDAPIRRPQLDELETFLLAARHGSLTRAAEELRLSKTAVAKRLRALEALVGDRLLDRGPRGASLTAAGRRLVPEVERLLAESERVFRRLSELRAREDPARISGLRSMSGASGVSTENVLAETELVFAEVFHSIDDGVAIIEVEGGTFLEVNEAFAAILGWSRGELLGRTAAELGIAPDGTHEATVGRAGEDALERATIEVRSKSGETVHVEFGARLVPIAGRPRLLAVGRDVSLRVRQERAMLKRAAQQQALAELTSAVLHGERASSIFARAPALIASHLDAALAAIWEVDDDGRIDLRSIYGAPPRAGRVTEARARSLRVLTETGELFVDDMSRDRRFAASEARKLGMRSLASVTIGRPGDEPHGFLTVASPEPGAFEDADADFLRAITHVLAVVVRGERRAVADERRRRQLEDFNALVEASRDATGLLAVDGTFAYLNPAARELLGLAPDEDVSGLALVDFDRRAARRLEERILPEVERVGRWTGRFTVGRPGGTGRAGGHLTMLRINDPESGATRFYSAIFRPFVR